ncbi:MAG: CHAT domain-containing tetratricopeptide repeat protein [Desulfomonilaceae bacterium]
MKRIFSIIILLCVTLFLFPSFGSAQFEQKGVAIFRQADEFLAKAHSRADVENALNKYQEALKIFERTGAVQRQGLTLNEIGSVYLTLDQYKKALEYFEKSLAVTKKIGDENRQGVTLGNIGAVYDSLGQHRRAIEYYERSLVIIKKLGDVQGEGVTLNNIGKACKSLGQYQKATEYYEKSLAIARKLGDVRGEGFTLNNIATVYDSLGQYRKAIEYYEMSLTFSRKLGDVRGEGATLGGMGLVYNNLGQYKKALEYFEKSLAIARRIGSDKQEGTALNNVGLVYVSLGQYRKAIEYYEKSLAIARKLGDVQQEGITLNNIGTIYHHCGQYQNALENYEKSLTISSRIGDVKQEGCTLNNIGSLYRYWGQYQKAAEYYDKSVAISRTIKDVKAEGVTFSNLGQVFRCWGQYQKAIEYYQRSLAISRKIGDVQAEGVSVCNLGETYAQLGKFDEALANLQKAFEIYTRIGVPTNSVKSLIGNLYLDNGEFNKSEAFTKESGYNSSLARLYLLQSDYPKAKTYYDNLLTSAEKNQDVDHLFTAYTGLGKVHEAIEDYNKAEECYEKGMKLAEEIRSGLLPSERNNFFEVRINGFYRSEPAKGLTRVRMKLDQTTQSIDSSEVTRARAFSDNIALRSEKGFSGINRDILEKEDVLVTKVAALRKELVKTDKEKQPDRYQNLLRDVHVAELGLKKFVEMLWDKHKAYAAVKYPRPVTLEESALRPEEITVMFDVLGEGVGVRLIRDKKINRAVYVKWDQKDLEKDVNKFREPFENRHFKEFDPQLAESFYKKLLLKVLVDVPKGTPLIIIPDGILALLPFEALVTGGQARWNKGEHGVDYPEGLTFLGDEHPISYYQSITALTLARTVGSKGKPEGQLLVLADPVFAMKDERAQKAESTKLAEREKQNNLQLMQTIEDVSDGSFRFKRLPQTGVLADNLGKMYGSNCLSLTGLKANKADFLSKIAPTINQYGSVVFATHGVMSTHVPGLMEPFLALTMAPPGTDGFLKMSDILSLKMNADVVALTACQSGLGKELSGEGVMSMGRAFQYAGAKSVLMTLWEVEEKSAVMLAENFFKYRKQGKTKLESLKLARDDIRNAGYKHPFFWSAFILVGETS